MAVPDILPTDGELYSMRGNRWRYSEDTSLDAFVNKESKWLGIQTISRIVVPNRLDDAMSAPSGIAEQDGEYLLYVNPLIGKHKSIRYGLLQICEAERKKGKTHIFSPSALSETLYAEGLRPLAIIGVWTFISGSVALGIAGIQPERQLSNTAIYAASLISSIGIGTITGTLLALDASTPSSKHNRMYRNIARYLARAFAKSTSPPPDAPSL